MRGRGEHMGGPARLGWSNVPEADTELLAAAVAALNKHAAVLREIGSAFDEAGHELYLVGGSVRDALRGRLSPDLDFTVAPRVRQAIDEMAPQLGRISAERVAGELDKLLLGDDPVAGIDLLVQTGMGEVVLPEVGGMQMAVDEHHQHKDVYQHSLTVLRQAIALEDDGPDLVLRWAALLHDIGKPATRRHETNGGVSFHHHEVVGAKMARKRLRALKYSKQMVDDISQLVYLHLRFHGYGEGRWTDSAVRRYVTDAGPLLPRPHKLVRAECSTRNKRRAAGLRASYDRLEARIAELAAQQDLARARPAVDGNASMQLLGVLPGPLVVQA